jgi:hypothetical protein
VLSASRLTNAYAEVQRSSNWCYFATFIIEKSSYILLDYCCNLKLVKCPNSSASGASADYPPRGAKVTPEP